MNLEKLFETQKVLRERINYQGNDRFNKLALALLVELGECANELPGIFKFWSNKENNFTKALEEYVDCLHFILELGIEMDLTPEEYFLQKEKNATDLFLTVNELAVKFEIYPSDYNYSLLFCRFKELGEHLGFAWEQVEQAYYSKNSINHKRQDEGY
jgi:dimeric dUTPase (all-alpha-NTP-PPase superfamily)